MKRSQINRAFREASACFARHHWHLPPSPKWDITDFGLGEFDRSGLTLINLATEPEYCEKLMWGRRGQCVVCHTHVRKKEDIICRVGELTIQLWGRRPVPGTPAGTVTVSVDDAPVTLPNGSRLVLKPGSRVTLLPGVWHAFSPSSDECIIGEVSTANDDVNDNVFLDPAVGRFPEIEEDEPALLRLVSE